MTYVNVVDGTSDAVSTSTPYIDLDLTARTTKRRALLGVPVRFVVCATASVAGDTGFVKLLDSAGTEKIAVSINKLGENWYVGDGYLPAAEDRYYVYFGGNIGGTLSVFAHSLFELMDTGPNAGVLSTSIGTIGLTAVAELSRMGVLDATIPAITSASTGTVDVQGSLAATIPAITATADGIASVAPAFVSAGTLAASTTTASPTWPTHAVGDIALLVVESSDEAISLSVAAGFVEVTSSPVSVGDGSTRLAVYWCRATTTSMSAPTVADSGDHTLARIWTFRGCVATGDPWDVIATSTTSGASTTTFPSVTTTKNNTLLALFAALSETSAAIGVLTNANLTGLTLQDNGGSSTTALGDDGSIAMGYGKWAGPGASGTTVSATNAASSAQARMTIALKAY